MPENIDRLTFMESKILELGKKQHEKGYQGGVFTPGFIRKETEYGYRAINIALESLIARGLVEKSVTNTFRNGSLVELDVYKITDTGLHIVDEVNAGAIKINGKEPAIQPNTDRPPEPRSYSKPWESPQSRKPIESRPANSDISQTVRTLESTVKAMADDMKLLHAKLDRILEARQTAGTPEPEGPKEPEEPKPRKRKPRELTREALFHRQLVLSATVSAGKQYDIVLADDVKTAYLDACKKAGVSPKGGTQFTTFLKRMQTEGLVVLKRAGCKALGIKGQGTRVVVSLTPDGQKMLGGKK